MPEVDGPDLRVGPRSPQPDGPLAIAQVAVAPSRAQTFTATSAGGGLEVGPRGLEACPDLARGCVAERLVWSSVVVVVAEGLDASLHRIHGAEGAVVVEPFAQRAVEALDLALGLGVIAAAVERVGAGCPDAALEQ